MVDHNGGVSYWYREIGIPAPGPALPGPRQADVCVVGAGYTGLWTAYYLKKADPGLRVIVLDERFAGFGASGRNGGWVLGEIAGSRERYARRHGRAAAVALQREMFEAVEEVVTVARAEDIDADVVKGGFVNIAVNPAQLRRLTGMVADDHAWGWEPGDIRLLDAAERDERLRVSGAVGASWSPHCARIQPAKLVRGLARVVRDLGVDVYEQTPVTEIRPRSSGAGPVAVTPYGNVEADYVIRATEGFTAALTGHHREWLPMNSSMIVTEPLGPGVWDEIGWRNRDLLGDLAHYYIYAQRTADDRIAFGGRGVPYHYGSRFDAGGGTQVRTVRELHRMLTRMFPGAAEARVAHAWSGVLGVPLDWCATVSLDHASGLGHAGGYTGHGVATANLAGRTLRDLLRRDDTALTALPWVNWRVRAWPPEPLRWLGVRAVYALYKTADAREARGLPRTSRIARAADLIARR